MIFPAMTLLITCLFIAALLPYLAKIPLSIAMHRSGGYDNNYPREQASRLTGFGARAWGAHQNSFESLIVFGIAVLSAIVTHHITPIVQGLAIVHIIARLVYHAFYLMNIASLRTLVWSIGYFASMIILGISIAN